MRCANVSFTILTVVATLLPGTTSAVTPNADRAAAVDATITQGPRSVDLPAPPSTTTPEAPPRSELPSVTATPDRRILAVDQTGEKFPAADPDIVRDGDVWRLFTTNVAWFNVPTWTSDDLVTWSFGGDALPVLPGWARPDGTWAPDVAQIGGRWVLYFSAYYGDTDLHCIGHAISATAMGPYEAFPDPIACDLEEGGSIDPMVHLGADSTPHLLWKVDANAIGEASTLRSQRLDPTGVSLRGMPSDLLVYGGGWEDPLIEQPEVIELDGVIHLFYAAGWFNTAGYQVGHAVCATLTDPCTRTTTDGGWLSSTDGVEGPGALSVVTVDGGLVGVYHAWTDGVRPDDDFRSLVVEPLHFVNGRPSATAR